MYGFSFNTTTHNTADPFGYSRGGGYDDTTSFPPSQSSADTGMSYLVKSWSNGSMIGASVGIPVGAAVGTSVGTSVGELVGAIDGVSVGVAVVGVAVVGMAVGYDVGDSVCKPRNNPILCNVDLSEEAGTSAGGGGGAAAALVAFDAADAD